MKLENCMLSFHEHIAKLRVYQGIKMVLKKFWIGVGISRSNSSIYFCLGNVFNLLIYNVTTNLFCQGRIYVPGFVFFLNTSLCLNTDGLSEKKKWRNWICKQNHQYFWRCKMTNGADMVLSRDSWPSIDFWTMKFRRINYSPKISYSAWE